MKALSELMTPQEEQEFIGSEKKELILYHHGMGRWIRNEWGLWEEGPLFVHMKELGFIHPDDMSQAIIEEYWARKNNQPSTLEESIKRYAEYWAQRDTE